MARKVILGSGKVSFYPHKLYCFNSVIDQVEGLLKRPGVPEMCEQWRERQLEDNIIADVYDGSIWMDFLKFKGDNIIVAGIIPEMAKEPKSLNTFLEPIVDVLKALWKGCKTFNQPEFNSTETPWCTYSCLS